ncbi:hypothetical protein SLS56_006984 [Neofusicoccum ribis]|uniref:C6 zinc finger domain protein n=1 Tax=Neofusicoccum ribis TaxID=45134 RepID=A0ABR3SPB8_9PEZI
MVGIERLRDVPEEEEGHGQAVIQRPTTSGPSFAIVLPDALARSALESKSLGLFWEAYFPGGKPFTSADARFTTGSWLTTLDASYQREAALKHALFAVSLGTLGRRQGDIQMMTQGLAFHGRALRDMARAVQSPERAWRDELLAAAKLMSILFGADEKDKLAQARSWKSHVNGELTLVQARGPYLHVSGIGHQLFVDGRYNMTILGVRTRKRMPLSSPEWKEIPWLLTPKTPKDALLDIMVDIPALLENFDHVQVCEGEYARDAHRAEVAQECWDLDRRLCEWAQNMTFFADIDTLTYVDQLDDFAMAQITYMYWACCILVFVTLRSANVARSEPAALPARTDPRIHARKIARSIAYFFGPDRGIFSTHAASFPMALALSVLSDGPSAEVDVPGGKNQHQEDRKLLTSIFSQPQTGATIGKFLNSMQQGFAEEFESRKEEAVRKQDAGWDVRTP